MVSSRQLSPLVLLVCLLGSASSLPLASDNSQATATEGAKSGGRLGGKRDFASYRHQGRPDVVAGVVAKAPHCRDTKAGCTHAAKLKARARKAAKLGAPTAEQAEANPLNPRTTPTLTLTLTLRHGP